jgi:hypothetical protein
MQQGQLKSIFRLKVQPRLNKNMSIEIKMNSKVDLDFDMANKEGKMRQIGSVRILHHDVMSMTLMAVAFLLKAEYCNGSIVVVNDNGELA